MFHHVQYMDHREPDAADAVWMSTKQVAIWCQMLFLTEKSW